MGRKRLWAILAAAVVAIVLVVLVVGRRRRADTVEAAPGPPAAQVALVQRGDIAQVLTLAGQFQPYQEIDVHPKVSGFIRHIYVDIGDKVHQGQTLAVLEIPELKAQLAGTGYAVQQSQDDITRAQHEVARAKATHDALHADWQRLQQTSQAQPGLVAQQELDDAQAKDLSSAADVDAAQAALSAAQKGLQVAQSRNSQVQAQWNYTNVVAPLDGVIIWRYADTGALIQGGTTSNNAALPIVKLAESGVMRLRLPVPEAYVKYVHMGDPVQLRVDALGRSFTGKVVRFTRELNFETRTMETEIDVENKNLAIDSGMYANAMMRLAHAESALTIPVGALMLVNPPNQASYDQVYVLDSSNHVHARRVDVGLRGNQLVQIKSGLDQGDRVIMAAQGKYSDGEAVTPVVTKTPASETAPQSGGVIDMNPNANTPGGGA